MTRRLGKLPAKHDPRSLRISRYLRPSLPPAPVKVDWSQGVAYGCLLNDQIGDCAIAGPDHLMQTWTALGGNECPITDAQALADYQAITRYDPSKTDANGDNPTDTGCVLLDVLKFWRNTGLAGRKILAFASTDPRNSIHFMQSAWLFGGLLIGFNLPQSAMEQTDAGQTWDVVPDSPNLGGHCVCVVGYNATGPVIVSWGQVIQTTWAFFETFCDEAWACISCDWAQEGKVAPSGFDLAALEADLNSL